EAEALSGHRIDSAEHLRDAARRIHDMGAGAVLITGGHRQAGLEHRPPEVVDLLFDGHHFIEFHTARIETPGTHGTGCTFAAAVAAHLALGRPLAEAAERAQRYVAAAIRNQLAIGHGQRLLDHFWGGILKE